MRKLLIYISVIVFAICSKSWATDLNGKSLHCLTEEKWLRDVHLIGERMFIFRDDKIAEIIVENSDPPVPRITKSVPYNVTVEEITFENHTLWRKTGRIFTSTGVYYQCDVFNDGMISLSPIITKIIEKYAEIIKNNKL